MKVISSLMLGLLLPIQTSQSAKLPPLRGNLGSHHHEVGTSSAKAQAYFDQGMVYLWAFNHGEAIRSFQAAGQLDPECIMAYWGIAYACGPNINRPMEAHAAGVAWENLQAALELKGKATAREWAYVQALRQRYSEEFSEDRTELDQAFADAMREVAAQYPDDLDAAVVFAEALMNTMPWDYWSNDLQPKEATKELLATLRSVLRRDPMHPGANHFFIHAVEAGAHPEDGIPAADRLGDLVPGAGHLVHMPSHIYVRVGQYADASAANERAIKADERYIRACKAEGFYPGAYYPHNLHFLWYAKSLEGRSREALAAANKVSKYALASICGAPTEVVEAPRLRHLPMLIMARFGMWDELLNEAKPQPKFVLDVALWHYARGLAHLAKGEVELATAASKALHLLAESDETKALDSPYLPASTVAAVADLVLEGKLAAARGATEQALETLHAAVDKEDELPYMEPPFWYYPVRQSLGAALLKADRPAEAEKQFRENLSHLPRNGWGLFGLEQALRRQGKTRDADVVQGQLEKAWERADKPLVLDWF